MFGKSSKCKVIWALLAAWITASCSSPPPVAETVAQDGGGDVAADAADEASDVPEVSVSTPEAGEAASTCEDGGCGPGCADACPILCGTLSQCGQRCVDTVTDKAHCGSCETACDEGKICRDSHCIVDCGDLTNCDDVCVDTTSSLENCGGCKKPCSAPMGKGKVACQAEKCVQTCDTGEPPCGGKCCEPGPPNTQITCTNDQCGSRCAGLTLDCSDGSHTCGSWRFESGTTEGITIDTGIAGGWDGITFASSTQRKFEGLRSLAVGVAPDGIQLAIRINLCSDPVATTNLDGLLGIRARLRVEPAQGSPTFDLTTTYANFEFRDQDSWCGYAEDLHLTDQDWSFLTGTFATNIYKPNVNYAILHISLTSPPAWTGTLFFDDIRIQ